MITSWILKGNQLVKDNERFLYNVHVGYTNTITEHMNHQKESLELIPDHVYLSIGASTTSSVIEMKSSFEHLFSVFSFYVLHLPSCKHKAWQPRIQGIQKSGDNKFLPGLL